MPYSLSPASYDRLVADPDEYLDDLLMFLEEQRVVPIIGPELLVVEHEGRRLLLHRLVAERLAAALRVPVDGMPDDWSIHDVVVRYVEQRGQPEQAYRRVRSIMGELQIPVPEPLKKLAGIADFPLFLTTTFDDLMARAVDEVRFDGRQGTETLVFTPTQAADLPEGWRKRPAAYVYHLLGKLSPIPNYVLTEEDTLEFLFAMQSESRAPALLLDELKGSHLLFLGCSFPDWLARFFLRTAKGGQLSLRRHEMEVLADSRAPRDAELALFLNAFSYNTKVFPGNAVEFIDMLAERWHQRHPAPLHAPAAASAAPAMDAADAPGEGMRPDAVFISYASEDRDAAARLNAGLGAAVDTWYDRDRLSGGDAYDARIRQNIRACSLFVPVLSVNTALRREGYFRREWKLAIDRAEGIARGTPFIIPVMVDDLPINAAGIPDEFWDLHAERLPGGTVTPEFLALITAKVRQLHIERMALR
jgi:hypothetical protein